MMTQHPIVRGYPKGMRPGRWHRYPACYLGHRHRQGCSVVVMPAGHVLVPRYDVRNHSPDGYEWGYCGSGPAQLALALLLDLLPGQEPWTMDTYQVLKREILGTITADLWCIHKADLLEWAHRHGAA
jgi:Family of unknown function (DUF6166)